MSEELEVLKVVTAGLDKADIPYIISGSMAANLYTIPRMTRDIDIVVELKSIQVNSFITIFEKDFYIDRDALEEALVHQSIFNVIHKEYVIKIDFIVRKASEFQESTFLRRRKVVVENQSMWFISPEDLILAKLLWAKDSYSEMQFNDVKNILRTSIDVDRGYIAGWINQMGLAEVAKKVGL